MTIMMIVVMVGPIDDSRNDGHIMMMIIMIMIIMMMIMMTLLFWLWWWEWWCDYNYNGNKMIMMVIMITQHNLSCYNANRHVNYRYDVVDRQSRNENI